MQSKAKNPDEYLQEVDDPERREALTRLRDLCREVLVGYEEVMGYGMPGYQKEGVDEVGFANQKQYISLYFTRLDVIEKNRDALKGLNVGKSCIRYSSPKKMDFGLIRTLLEDTVKSTDLPG